MSRTQTIEDPWRLVWGEPFIDCQTLASAIEADLTRDPRPDFRTRLLVRDAAVAIRSHWGARRFQQWLATSPAGQRIRTIVNEDLGETGFPAIRRRLVDSIDLTRLKRIFDLLGRAIQKPHEKHRSDLGVLALKLDKETAKGRLLTDGRSFFDDPKLRPQIEENWRFIFQEPLVVEQAATASELAQGLSRSPRRAAPGKARPKPSKKRARAQKEGEGCA